MEIKRTLKLYNSQIDNFEAAYKTKVADKLVSNPIYPSSTGSGTGVASRATDLIGWALIELDLGIISANKNGSTDKFLDGTGNKYKTFGATSDNKWYPAIQLKFQGKDGTEPTILNDANYDYRVILSPWNCTGTSLDNYSDTYTTNITRHFNTSILNDFLVKPEKALDDSVNPEKTSLDFNAVGLDFRLSQDYFNDRYLGDTLVETTGDVTASSKINKIFMIPSKEFKGKKSIFGEALDDWSNANTKGLQTYELFQMVGPELTKINSVTWSPNSSVGTKTFAGTENNNYVICIPVTNDMTIPESVCADSTWGTNSFTVTQNSNLSTKGLPSLKKTMEISLIFRKATTGNTDETGNALPYFEDKVMFVNHTNKNIEFDNIYDTSYIPTMTPKVNYVTADTGKNKIDDKNISYFSINGFKFIYGCQTCNTAGNSTNYFYQYVDVIPNYDLETRNITNDTPEIVISYPKLSNMLTLETDTN